MADATDSAQMITISASDRSTVQRRFLSFLPYWLLLLLHILLQTQNVYAIEPFSTDGCSVFPDGTLQQKSLWLNCCIEHDKAYWQGGTYFERVDADRRLRDCVIDAGEPFIAQIMLEGVRIGGSPFWPTPYRWGYGWPSLRGYKLLSEKERAQIKIRLQEIERQTRIHQ